MFPDGLDSHGVDVLDAALLPALRGERTDGVGEIDALDRAAGPKPTGRRVALVALLVALPKRLQTGRGGPPCDDRFQALGPEYRTGTAPPGMCLPASEAIVA